MDIILIPGLWLDGRAWDDVLPHIKGGGHNPLPMTLPGQGDGGPEATLDDQLNALRSCLDSLDAPALVVGHSGHATLAWLGADRMPDKVAGVAMVGGMPEAEGNPYFSTARLWDDGVITPWKTREILALGLAAHCAPDGQRSLCSCTVSDAVSEDNRREEPSCRDSHCAWWRRHSCAIGWSGRTCVRVGG